MLKLECPFYEISKPLNNEIVLVTFTNRGKSFFDGKLEEYNCNAFLNFSDATKKRTVTSWNKIVPLEKEMFARVDDSNYSKDIVQVSLLDNKEKELINFDKNRLLLSIFKKLSFISKKDLTSLWKNIIYKIDINRRDEYDVDSMPCLFDYCCEEKDFVESVFVDSDNSELFELFFNNIEKVTKEKPYKITSQVEIISNGPVQNTINLIRSGLSTLEYEYSMKYQSAPIFSFQTNSVDSSDEILSCFITLCPNIIFVKISP